MDEFLIYIYICVYIYIYIYSECKIFKCDLNSNFSRQIHYFSRTCFKQIQQPRVCKVNHNAGSAGHHPATASASGYTTILISKSFQNLSTFSRRRPWPEFLSTASAFDCPEFLSAAAARSCLNSKYFGGNYAIVISTYAASSLLGAPFSLIMFALVFWLWLALYFFREEPIVVWGHHVSDQVVIVGLILVSVLGVWITGIFTGIFNLLIGISVGILISTLHGVFRNPEGLFMDENDALANGLIGSQSDSDSYRVHFSN